jgi:hypothetical protein
MHRVYQAVGPTDAYLVRDWLERNEIRAWVRGEHLVSLRGDLPVIWPSVWVALGDRDRAEAAVQTFNQPMLVHPDWLCACGEVNGPTFASCWSCGKDAA